MSTARKPFSRAAREPLRRVASTLHSMFRSAGLRTARLLSRHTARCPAASPLPTALRPSPQAHASPLASQIGAHRGVHDDITQSAYASLDLDEYALPPEALEQIMSPALLIYMDKVRHNIRTVIDLCGGDPGRWRPHVKTTKSVEVWEALVDAGVLQFKAATSREALLLGRLLQRKTGGQPGGDILVS